jgi:endonuclease/exonuclease/phosphatase family metal-dependent hydrolase
MLRLLTYNVHRWVGTDRQVSPMRVAEVIASCEPDVVALQEVRIGRSGFGGVGQAAAVAAYLGMDMHFQPTVRVMGEQLGLAVLTARPSRLVKAGPLIGQNGSFFERRSALWVTIDCGDGELHLVNAHLSLRPRERTAQADVLLGPDWLGHPQCRGPVILAGDFNASPRSRAYNVLTRELRDVQVVTDGRPRPTFHTRMPLVRLDHIFVNASVEVVEAAPVATPLARVASDHLPLVADLRLSTQAAESRPVRLRRAVQAA